MRISILPLITIAILLPIAATANSNVHVARHWHLHQPIYWPEWNSNGPQTQRYQYGWDSLQIKFNNGNRYPGSSHRHPQNNLVQGDPEGQYDAVFSPDDRTRAYQGGPKESLSRIIDLPFAGYSMSYSGALIENVNSFANNNAYGYSPSWRQNFIDMRNWTVQSGQRRHDLVGFTYHHSFGPLIPKSVLRKELQIFKEIYWKTWAGNPDKSDHSKGFWPAEAAFSRHMIDVLVDEGYQWAIVANSHLSRTAQNFNEVASLGNTTSNIDPPNRADRLGPFIPANQWWSGSLDGRGAWQAAPFAYQAHKAQYVNPSTGEIKKITIVPMDDVISYQLGYGSTGTDTIANKIEPFATDPNRPVIVLVSTDGENAWGGGYDSWQNATPGFIREAHGRGYEATVIQKFLDDHPVPDSATVHIEDGSWFNAANDWGHPQFINWLYPPVSTDNTKINNLATRYDFETPGFSEDFRNWAVLIAGTNWMETAEQIYKELNGPNSVQAWRIQEPYQANGTYNNPNVVEKGWHIFLAGFDSGFMYYGDSLDDEVKQSLASNRAIAQVKSLVESNIAIDKTPPTIFKPQRFPWNPGGKGWGPLTLYMPVGFNGAPPWPSEFYIWTHVYDVSGVQQVNLRVRIDNDGVNSMQNIQNETFAGGPDVGPWIQIPMQKRILPRNNPTNNTQLNFFITPDYMADYYFAKITDQNVPNFRGKLLDYYITATDSKGNISNSDIQHVFVENDGNIPVIPSIPTGLAATTPSSTQVNLTWTAVPGATTYIIKRNNVQVGTSNTASYNDTNLIPQTQYCYSVAAQNTAGTSAYSTTHCVTTPAATPPPTPTGFTSPNQSNNSINLSWTPTPGAAHYTLRREGNIIASNLTGTTYTDTGLSPQTSYTYTLQAHNIYGNSPQTAPLTVATTSAPIQFNMDGQFENNNYLISDNGMRLYAALRGTKLYVATWATGASPASNDHFIFISDTLLPTATTPAVWAKSGQIAIPASKPYLAGEGSNNYRAWFNAGTNTQSAEGTGPQALEGVIDLVEAFGNVPQNLYLAAVAYGNNDGSGIASQAPAGNGNNILEPNEFFHIPTIALRDENADFTFDRLDPARDFIIQHTITSSGDLQLTFNTFPGRSYQVQHSLDMISWQNIGNPITAGSGEITRNFTHNAAVTNNPRSFYRIRLNP
jgi:hypothetical protein